MDKITIWHNPRCTKSREALKELENQNAECEIVKYLDQTPSIEELKRVFKMLGFKSVREWMRTKEAIYKELDLKNETDEQKLLEAMANHPKLIERPVLIKSGKALIARPSTLVEDFIKS